MGASLSTQNKASTLPVPVSILLPTPVSFVVVSSPLDKIFSKWCLRRNTVDFNIWKFRRWFTQATSRCYRIFALGVYENLENEKFVCVKNWLTWLHLLVVKVFLLLGNVGCVLDRCCLNQTLSSKSSQVQSGSNNTHNQNTGRGRWVISDQHTPAGWGALPLVQATSIQHTTNIAQQ